MYEAVSFITCFGLVKPHLIIHVMLLGSYLVYDSLLSSSTASLPGPFVVQPLQQCNYMPPKSLWISFLEL